LKKRSHVSIWKWIQKYRSEEKILCKRRRISGGFIVDETQIKVGKEYFFWIWIAIEPINKVILDIYLSAERRTCLLPRSFYIL
jgi:putative transposase